MSTDDAAPTAVRILDAALPVFAQHGFAGASTRALAAAAGVNIATIAYHFGDKQGLYDAVVDHIYARLLQLELPPPDQLGADPAARVRALTALLYRHARSHADGIRLLLRHVMEHRGSPARVRQHWGLTVLSRAGDMLSSLGLDRGAPADLRLSLLSLNHLIARYAVTEPADLLPFVDDDPEAAVAAHLGDLAVALLHR